jgi:hypothetical protein
MRLFSPDDRERASCSAAEGIAYCFHRAPSMKVGCKRFAPGASLLDTTDLDIEAAFRAALGLFESS